MTFYLILIFILHIVLHMKNLSKYFVFVATIFFTLYVSSFFIPSLMFFNMPTSVNSLAPLCVLFGGVMYYGVLAFMEKPVDEKKLKLLLLTINIMPYENLLFTLVCILLLVLFEIYERSISAGYLVKTPLLYFFVLLPLIIHISFEQVGTDLVNIFYIAFFYLTLVDLSKISIYRLFAMLLISIKVYSFGGSIFLIITSSLLFVAMFSLSELFKFNLLNKQSLNQKFITRFLTKFIVISEKKETENLILDMQYKKNRYVNESEEHAVGYFNDVKANFLFVVAFFAIVSLFIILKGV